MNNNILSHCCQSMNKHTYNIIGDLEVGVTVTSNPFRIPSDRLFGMAARINKKRSFLFVSKVLGKHIAVNPYVSLLSGVSLALLLIDSLKGAAEERFTELAVQGLVEPSRAKDAYDEIMRSKLQLPYPVKVIGFAETATAIGHAVFASFERHCSYIHTSREQIIELPSLLNFEEEHSHAVAHRCYALDSAVIAGDEPIVLVDDEITTGNTSLNIIRDIHGKYPREQYYVLSLLDWRTQEDQQRFLDLERELGVKIKTLALVKGEIEVAGTTPDESVVQSYSDCSQSRSGDGIRILFLDSCFEHLNVTSEDGQGLKNESPYLIYSGRFGISSQDNGPVDVSVARAAQQLAKTRTGAKTLCMGTGEFMYLPMRIAAQMGEGVWYQSTTRSPIHPSDADGYAVRSAYSYPSPEDPDIKHFLYNLTHGSYDDLYLFFEREVAPSAIRPLIDILRTLDLRKVNIVFCSPKRYDWEEYKLL